MNQKKIERAVRSAIHIASKWKEGNVIIQLYPTNRSFLISHYLGNNWESMGLNAQESENRIMASFDCREEFDENNYDKRWFKDIVKDIQKAVVNI